MITLTITRNLSLALIASAVLSTAVQAESIDLGPVEAWLEKARETSTVQAEFTQTRWLKTFTRPLKSEGQLFFARPDLFRWEIKDPSPSMAIVGREKITILYPELNRAERFSREQVERSEWGDSFELMRTGFPQDIQTLKRRFNILSLEKAGPNGTYALRLEVKGKKRKNPVEQAQIEFDATRGLLLATELFFKDGSRMRNEFRNVQLNRQLPADVFEAQIPSGYQVAEPLGRQ